MENPLPHIPNPWKIFREDLKRVCDKESREVLPKRWMRVARFILLAYRKFDEERCYMRAAALAFNSLLALVPVLALATAITAAVTNDKSESVQKFVSQVIVSVLPASANQKEPEVSGGKSKYILERWDSDSRRRRHHVYPRSENQR